MDTYLAIASKRDERRYADRAIPPEIVTRMLDAGRLSGSSQNRQPWRFIVVESFVDELAECVYAPNNVRTAQLVIAIVGKGFDLGRAAQNIMLAAWNDGVLSCPNGIKDKERAAQLLGDEPGIVLSLGYPARRRGVDSRSADEWSSRANRRPLDEFVEVR